MATSIKYVHDFVFFVADKTSHKKQRRSDIDLAAYHASLELFADYKKKYEETSTVGEYMSVFEGIEAYDDLGDEVQDTATLTAIAYASISHRERRYVTDESAYFYYDANSNGPSGLDTLAPDDQPSATNYATQAAMIAAQGSQTIGDLYSNDEDVDVIYQLDVKTSTIGDYSISEIKGFWIRLNVGDYVKPDDYNRYTKITTDTGQPVEVIRTDAWDKRAKHPNRPPSSSYAIARIGNSRIYVLPTTTNIELYYFKHPVKPVYAMASDGSYDDINSVDLEWDMELWPELSYLILGKLGMNLSAPQIVQYSEMQKR